MPFDTDGPQQGIVTPRQRHLVVATFTLDETLRDAFGRNEIAGLLQDWSAAARRLATGEPVDDGGTAASDLGAPPDTGESTGLGASGLTLTFGFGGAVFDVGRGLVTREQVPADLRARLPAFDGDDLQERWAGGDLLVCAGADDPQVAIHAIHQLSRLAGGAASLYWLQRGFLPDAPGTPRNLMGFKDGTATLEGAADDVLARHLWVGAEGPDWLRDGGTLLVVRRIRMLLEPWDRTTVADQEDIVGRTKGEGAPLGQRREDDPVDLAKLTTTGEYMVPERSHVAIAHRLSARGARIHRRPYSYADGVDPATGQLDAGLIFLAFQRSVADQFVPLQRELAKLDALGAYTQAIGSAVFAIPPASRHGGDWVGRTLFS